MFCTDACPLCPFVCVEVLTEEVDERVLLVEEIVVCELDGALVSLEVADV